MADNSSLYGSTPPSGTVSSSNYTTLYSGNNNYVPSGDNVIISGTLTVNGCAILTDCSAFSLLPANATTINFGNSATAISIGGDTGVTTIQNQLSTGNYLFPLADGTADQILATDGNGILYWADVQSLDTNYSIQADTTTGGANLTLVGSDATTDSVKFASGTGVTIVRTDANTITTSIGQDVATSASPTFENLLLNGNITLNNDAGASDSVITAKYSAGTSTLRWNGTQWRLDDNIYITQTAATTNSKVAPVLLVAQSSGTTNVGFATALDFQTESTSSGNLNSGYISVRMDDNTPGSEDFSMRFGLMKNGAVYDNKAILDSSGNLTLEGGITVSGSTSGSSTFNAPATGSTLTYTLPGSAGGAFTVLTNDGSGNLSWALPGGGGSTFGNITIAVDTDNTISTTTGDLLLDSASGTIEMDGIVNIKGDYLNLNSDNSAVDSAMRFNATAEILYNYADSQFEISKGISVDSGVLFVDATNNRVGINNTAPDYELHIDQGQDGITQFAMTTGERTALWTMNDGDDLLSLTYGTNPAPGPNRLQFDPTNQWFNLGNLGVGTNTPTEVLDVAGNGKFSGDVAVNGGDITTTSTTANIFTNTATTINIGGAGDGTLAGGGEIILGVQGNTWNVGVEALLTQNGTTTQATGNYNNITQTTPYQIMSTTRKAMKGFVTVTDDVTGAIHAVEYLAIRKTSTAAAYITIYGEIFSDAPLATFTVTDNGTSLVLYASPLSTNSTDITVMRHSLGD